MQSFLLAMRGGVNTAWLKDHSYTQRGSFPATELLTNNTFANGTTGYATGSFTLAVADRILRALRVENLASVTSIVRLSAAATVVQYAPYVLRVMALAGRGSFADLSLRADSTDNGTEYGQSALTLTHGLLTLAFTALATSLRAGLYQQNNTVSIAGDYLDTAYFSVARCALVDNGPNALKWSDALTGASPQIWVPTRSSVAANITSPVGAVAPDGTNTAESIIEDATASNSHYLSQAITVASTALDYSFSVSLRAGERTFAELSMIESTSSHQCVVDANLTAGTIGTAAVDGANWTNPRAYIVSEGNGWYRVTVVGRKASAGTTVTARIYMASALGTISYSGNGTSKIFAWRASLAQSSVPVRGVLTSATADADGTTQALAGGLYTKGWPVSTSGLLYAGDQVQIGNQLLVVTAPVNSDAAGLAFLQTSPALRSAPADNAPVIINQPMAKFMLSNNAQGWSSRPGTFSDATIELEEDLR
jgi:hypothetical protein